MNKVEKFFEDFKNTLIVLSGFAVVVGFFIGADSYISNKIEDKITDTAYINNLAHILRPYVIFNKNGVIQYDHGGVLSPVIKRALTPN